MRIGIVMVTIDREKTGRKNYISDTLWDIHRSGLTCSNTPYVFHLFDGGSKSLEYIVGSYRRSVFNVLWESEVKLAPNVNVGRALVFGGQLDVDWVLFLEDDIEFCKNFLDGVAWWLGHYAGTKHRLFTFYTPYREILTEYNKILECSNNINVSTWEYPVDKFYGTQAFAVRPREAQSIGEYLVNLPYPTSGYDIEIQNWAKANPIQKEPENFLSSVPCFVQHIGEQSVLFNDPKRFHQTSGFIGKDWVAYSE